MPPNSNSFEVLGLAQDCTLDQAKIHFRKLALKFHPDKVPADQKETATAKMALLNAAMDKVREILGNASRFQDSKSHSERPKSRANTKPKNPHESFVQIYEKFQIRLESLSSWVKAHSCSDPGHRAELESTGIACDRAILDLVKDKPSFESEVPKWTAHWNDVLEKLTSKVQQVTEVFPCCDRAESSDSYASASSDREKARSQNRQHAKLLHKIEEISNIIKTRTSSQEGMALTGMARLKEQLQFASRLAHTGSLQAARISTKRICTVVEAVRKRVKELERRANIRRTIGSQYRVEEVEGLNHTVSNLIADLLTGERNSTGTKINAERHEGESER